MKNHGVLEGKRDTDFVAGTIQYEIRNPSGDWTAYLPPGEWQANSNVDTMACVSFSALNSLETQYKFLTGESRNFSDRFTAKMSGTTIDGNWLWKVGDSLRHHGVVDEAIYPSPPNFTWSDYYTEVPESVKAKAKEFLNEWKVQYEWIDPSKESILHHIKQAPIQVVIPGHAVLGFLRTNDVLHYFDTYVPFMKTRTEPISSALKIVLSANKRLMTAEEVKLEYNLAFYRDPSVEELNYWTGKPHLEMLKTAIADRAAFLQNVSNNHQ